MKRLIFTLTIAALVLPATALAKGPTAATMDGPGAGGGGISFGGDEGSGPLGALTEQAGFFPAVFRQQPDPMLDSPPKGNLGPKYTITYTVPGPNNEIWKLRQDVYPYATPAPVTYMAPGQEVFETEGTRGGWFQAGPQLKETLVAAGLPQTAPTVGSTDGNSFPTTAVSLLVFGLVFVSAAAVLLRRRARPAAA
jgi:hypothetical protein